MWKDRLPDSYEMFVRDGGSGAAEFEIIIQEAVNAGFDPEWSVKSYLMGTNRLKPTHERYNLLHDKAKSSIEDLYQVGLKLPPLP